jgi:hypothetical protein
LQPPHKGKGKGKIAEADRRYAAAIIAENARELEQLAESVGLDVLARLFSLVKILVRAELKTPADEAKTTDKR